MSAERRPSGPPVEGPQVATRPVLYAAFGFLGFVTLSLVGLRAYYAWSVERPVVVTPRPFPEPRLGTDAGGELKRLQAEQRRRLSTYAWVDRERELVQVPIERAVDLLARRGQDAYAPLEAPPTTPDPRAAAAEAVTAAQGRAAGGKVR